MMLEECTNNICKKQNTVVIVESLLFVTGIHNILKFYNINSYISSKEILSNGIDQFESIIIIQVPSKETEEYAKKLISLDSSTKIIIIKDSINMFTINKLIHIGVKGICLNDISELFLIDLVKQVHIGHFMLDTRFTDDFFNYYKELYEIHEIYRQLDDTDLKLILTSREIEILGLLSKGLSNKEISKELTISDKTVKNHVGNLLQKMEVQDRLNAVIKAVKNRWIII
ncbi:response regulator transcription factor [Bacillus sp. OAE603]|uniref:response regulator transcription factor n=1 Tax=Gottfriedia sp. OAE603 TaxID=2663872 RepID=UPI00178BFB34